MPGQHGWLHAKIDDPTVPDPITVLETIMEFVCQGPPATLCHDSDARWLACIT